MIRLMNVRTYGVERILEWRMSWKLRRRCSESGNLNGNCREVAIFSNHEGLAVARELMTEVR